jgi:hypothetical protein
MHTAVLSADMLSERWCYFCSIGSGGEKIRRKRDISLHPAHNPLSRVVNLILVFATCLNATACIFRAHCTLYVSLDSENKQILFSSLHTIKLVVFVM